mmetsp:Transcript_28501/g.53459  ORF Transcript_28501/g.53459 Transcript_28501/m.53459 type:complete len:246 (+) Transcript_28501:4189-4926(+)
MQERCDDGGIIQLLFRQDRGHGDGVREVGFARMTKLALMHLTAKIIGVPNESFVGFGIIVADQSDQIVSRDHTVRTLTVGLALALRCHQLTQQHLFGHAVFFGLVLLGPHEERHCVLFGLVDLDLGLVRFDQTLAQFVGALCLVGDLTQGHDRVLVVVAVHGDRRTGRDFACPMCGQHHQFETVWNLVNAVFNSHAGHGMLQINTKRVEVGYLGPFRANDKAQKGRVKRVWRQARSGPIHRRAGP